ncbi:hypothetical protein [Parerythrobacter aestuarii]|uniref:hypothetical protein n=1 Tax=Parerythrobacter aestuarii TaxID=3020909 RepID=UPI0024DE62DE|nr:hypothetical protein [Parerythrobacter aestuarii]
MKRSLAVLPSLLLLFGCKEMQPALAEFGYTHSLGKFEVERVSIVPTMPTPGDGYDGGGWLKVELSSPRQLRKEYPTYWVGAASDYCPLEDDHELIALGVFDKQVGFWDIEVDPIEQSPDGLYRYQIYVVRAYPPPGKTHDDYGTPRTGPYAQREYDLYEDGNDVCLQVFGGDHYHVFARSSVITVPYETIMAAKAQSEAKATP